jgi:hypothetical protein
MLRPSMDKQYGRGIFRAKLGEVQLDAARVHEAVAGAGQEWQVSAESRFHKERLPT